MNLSEEIRETDLVEVTIEGSQNNGTHIERLIETPDILITVKVENTDRSVESPPGAITKVAKEPSPPQEATEVVNKEVKKEEDQEMTEVARVDEKIEQKVDHKPITPMNGDISKVSRLIKRSVYYKLASKSSLYDILGQPISIPSLIQIRSAVVGY